MLKKIASGLRLSPSTAMSFAALVISLGGAGYAATGGTFVLGVANSATTPTLLTASINGKSLVVTNKSAKPKASALQLVVAPGLPPLNVNSTGRVKNLNADLLDGIDSANLASVVRVPFALLPMTETAPILLPPNTPVAVTAAVSTISDAGEGGVTMVRIPGSYLAWSGASFTDTRSAGESGVAGHHVLYIDSSGHVELQVDSPDTIKVRNDSNQAQTGFVVLTY